MSSFPDTVCEPVKNHHTKRLLLCVLLSLVVHAGLATTIFSVVKPRPGQLEVMDPIQVSLVQNFSDPLGSVATHLTVAGSRQNIIQEELHPSTTPKEINRVPTATDEVVANASVSEVNHNKTVSQSLRSIDRTEPSPSPPLAIKPATVGLPEPEVQPSHTSVDKTPKNVDRLQPFTRPESLNQVSNPMKAAILTKENPSEDVTVSHEPDSHHPIPNEPHVQPAGVNLEVRTDRNASVPPTIDEFAEQPATHQNMQNVAMLITEPVPEPFTLSALEHLDFDGEIEHWRPFHHREPVAIASTLNHSALTNQSSTQLLENVDDADQIAGITPEPENDRVVVETTDVRADATDEPTVSPSQIQLASQVDFELQIEQPRYMNSEMDVLDQSVVDHSDPIRIQPELPAVAKKPVNKQLAVKSDVQQDRSEIKASESMAPESVVEQAKHTLNDSSVKPPKFNMPKTQLSMTQDAITKNEHPHPVEETQVASIEATPLLSKQKDQSKLSQPPQQASLGPVARDRVPRYGIKGLPNPAPRYPYLSRVNEEEGDVLLRVVVDPKGRVAEINIIQSSGYSRLDKAARKAVKRWKFQPALKDGLAIEGVVKIPISFVLEDA